MQRPEEVPRAELRQWSISDQYHRSGAATDSEITPDKRIEPTWEEFRAGRDPVMEWILLFADSPS